MRRGAQGGTVDAGEVEQAAQVQRAGKAVDLLVGDVELFDEQLECHVVMSSVISSQIGGPNRRRSSSASSAWMRFSLSSSSMSKSSLRVRRNAWWSSTSIP